MFILVGGVPVCRYVGRAPAASTATGDKYVHKAEQSSLIEQAVLHEFEGELPVLASGLPVIDRLVQYYAETVVCVP